ncbi:hypothetical protein PR048_026885 [Dryococelus australis]|uniref:Uncharacterized protein n=1 Tax=Dryococelus australis TaxID=614101 RepID=A0ABQ9GMJ2_9NEOP|nr:hypothetical protein PR048_026885 [Dryococelus australis]
MTDANRLSSLDLTGNVSENWRKFKQNFKIYMVASRKSEKLTEVKATILFYLVGEDAVEVFNTFQISDKDRTDYSKQEDNEPFQLFLNYLIKLVHSCEFREQSDAIVGDCIFMGVRNTAFQQEMLRINNLTLEKACELVHNSFSVYKVSRKDKGLMIQP